MISQHVTAGVIHKSSELVPSPYYFFYWQPATRFETNILRFCGLKLWENRQS